MNFKYIIIAFEVIIIILLLVRSSNMEGFASDQEGNGLNSFDKYYYINLPNRKDRKEQILNEMKKIGLPKEKRPAQPTPPLTLMN